MRKQIRTFLDERVDQLPGQYRLVKFDDASHAEDAYRHGYGRFGGAGYVRGRVSALSNFRNSPTSAPPSANKFKRRVQRAS